MKFSFSLIKKFAPGKYSKEDLTEKLNAHSFETVDLGGDVLEISVPPNRWTDGASHLGIAREAAAIFKVKFNDPLADNFKPDSKERGIFTVNIKNPELCNRYLATYVSNVKIGPSPQWLKDALESCGLRPISNIVDIMNYVMVEIGQPLHAFDADKISGGIIVRTAKKGESFETIDSKVFELTPEILVISDAERAQAIAGIKGGKFGEVSSKTDKILIEAASFSGANIYRSVRKLGLATDASQRFSHELSPELAAMAMKRALQLIKELAGGKVYMTIDAYPKKQKKKVFKLDLKEINRIIGREFALKEAMDYLLPLGFKKSGNKIEAPAFRPDIQDIEDVAEEIARLYGYNNLKAEAPLVALGVASQENSVSVKDRARAMLIKSGLSEVYNYSFASHNETGENAVEIANPMSAQYQFLRDSLSPGLIKNLEDNSRFFDAVRIFEIGNVFSLVGGKVKESLMLGLAVKSKDGALEMKGLIDSLLSGFGLTDYDMAEKSSNTLIFEVDGKEIGMMEVVSGMKGAVIASFELMKIADITGEELEFRPIPKFPSIVRDLSVFLPAETRVGPILETIQEVSSKLVNDVDLIDFYEPPVEAKRDRSANEPARRKSLTFRIVFQADDRTLSDAEADREMAIINQVIIDKFNAELR